MRASLPYPPAGGTLKYAEGHRKVDLKGVAMQLTLSSPEITCDHCIATIRRTVDSVEGAHFLQGDWETKQFAIDIASGGLLEQISAALESEGYPLGEAGVATGSGGPKPLNLDWRPSYRVTATNKGADVNYACPCSCEAGFALDRSGAEQSSEHCCCGRTILVGRNAATNLKAALGSDGYQYDVQTVTMPWGQPMEVALAIPTDAEHGAHAED